MKLASTLFLAALGLASLTVSSQPARAELGKSTGCFTLAVNVPSTSTEEAKWVTLSTGAVMCVSEKDMVKVDELTFTGKIVVTITQKGKVVSKLYYGAKTSEGAAGTSYVTYGATLKEVTPTEGEVNKWEVLSLKLTNDYVKVGQRAGEMELAGATITLLQRK